MGSGPLPQPVPSARQARLPLIQLSFQKAFVTSRMGDTSLSWDPTTLVLPHQTQASPGTGHHPELVSWAWTIPSVDTGSLELPELSAGLGTNVGVP